MIRFYIAPRGDLQAIAKHWDWFMKVYTTMFLPPIGVLLVPDQVLKGESKVLEEYGIPIALDNGAFQLLKADFDSRVALSDEAIVRWFVTLGKAVERHEWEWVALPDVPVHGRKFVGRDERARRIELTYILHRMFLEYTEELGIDANYRIVIQGYEPEEYMRSLRMNEGLVREFGTRFDRVIGVGSVCVRKNSSVTNLASGKARGTVEELRAVLDTEPHWYFIGYHFFGLHGRFVRSLKNHTRFVSSDSGAGGVIFRYEIKDIKKTLGINWNSREKDYALAHLVQYVRSVRGLDKLALEVIASIIS